MKSRKIWKTVLIALGCALGAWAFGALLLPVLLPFFIGLAVSLLAEKPVRLLQTRAHVPRSLASGLCVLLLFGLLFGGLFFLCRLLCAEAADLTIVLYNPASHGRPDHVKRACDILLRRLPEDRLCGIVRNIGRDGQSRRILTLAELREAEVDMFCTVFIGNSAAKTVAGQLITPRGYRNV